MDLELYRQEQLAIIADIEANIAWCEEHNFRIGHRSSEGDWTDTTDAHLERQRRYLEAMKRAIAMVEGKIAESSASPSA